MGFKTQHISFLIISILLFGLAILSGMIMKSSPDYDRQLAKVQDYLNRKTASLETLSQELLSKTLPWEYTEFLQRYDLENDVSFLIYQNDQLIFWSDNQSSEVYDRDISNNSLVATNNTYYLAIIKSESDYRVMAYLLLAQDYSIENQFVRSGFNRNFGLPDNAKISLDPLGEHRIRNSHGEFLFTIEFGNPTGLNEIQYLALLFFYLLAFGFAIAFLYQVFLKFSERYNKRIAFISLIITIVFLRILLFVLEIPVILYDSRLFSPSILAIPLFAPSLGDLLITSYVILFISIFFFRSFNFKIHENVPIFRKYFIAFSLLFHVFIFYSVYLFIVERIIFDSIISLSADRILDIQYYDILGFLILGLLSISYILVSIKLIRESYKLIRNINRFYLLILSSSAIYIIAQYIRYVTIEHTVVLVIVFILVVIYSKSNNESRFNFKRIIYPILVLSVATSIHTIRLNDIKDLENRKQYTLDLAYNQDRILEYRFSKIEQELTTDSLLINFINSLEIFNENEDALLEHITNTYFNSLKSRYDFSVTLCYPNKMLRIRPEDYVVNCKQYFMNYINTVGVPTDIANLYYIYPGLNYMSYINLNKLNNNLRDIFLFVDISAKSTLQGIGYPELLIDERGTRKIDLYNYSYAIYFNRNIVRSFGKYPYPTFLGTEDKIHDNYSVYYENSFSHVAYMADNQNIIMISREIGGLQQLIASFSYLFLIMFLVAGITYILLSGNWLITRGISYKNRIQASIVGLIVVSFIFIGVTTVLFLISLNSKKNLSILSERNHSVLIEVEQYIADIDTLDYQHAEELEDFLLRLSLTFFSDINIFDKRGLLLASSRPQIFEEGLIARRLHPRAVNSLITRQESFFIQQESIGRYVYLSSYLPFRNLNNEIIGFVNLPYFARQNDLRQEIAAFLVAYINIYVILIGAGVLVALLLTNHLLKPLNLLKQNIANIKLRESSKQIEWKHDDEIGELISEYNRMTEELAKSAELLARSEREGAWREMARQVAHEIKNPLTPMKLSTQHLQKSWNDGTGNWDERLSRYTESIIKQIDTLSDIASAFSDFALMPVAKREKVDLIEIIHNAQVLYQDLPNISIRILKSKETKCVFILADRRQILRVFNNLLKNAVEAIGANETGRVNVEIFKESDIWIIKVSDNGPGIDEDKKQNIFRPYFTTKSGGMGLGLAIVKSIVNSFDGEISFESDATRGTIFKMSFPAIVDTCEQDVEGEK